nr:hypothetical protein [Tanacetum cinerariifolium]
MTLESVENGPLIWLTIKENGVTRTKKYAELFAIEKIQADCDMKATNIILQAFLIAVASLRFPSTNNQLKTSSNPRNQSTIQDGRVIVKQVQGRQGQSYFGTSYKSNAFNSGENNASGHIRVVKCYNCQDEEQLAFLANPWVRNGQAVQTINPDNVTFQTGDLDTYDSDCDDILNVKAVLMAKISNYDYDIISEGFAAASTVLKLEHLKVDRHGMSEPMSYYLID